MNSEHPLQQRRWAVITAFQRGKTRVAEIARETGEGRRFVRRTLSRYQKTGGVEDLPRSGRPRKLRPGTARKLLKSKRTGSLRRAARELKREEYLDVSPTTILRQAKREKLRYRVRPKKPLLTPAHMKARLDFANVARQRGFWKRVVASDEKTFSVLSNVRGQWCDEGEEPHPRETQKWPGGLKVWAGTSWEGKTQLHFLPKSMKGQDYVEFIKLKAEPDLIRLYPYRTKPPIWLQDREGFHTAKVVQKYLQKSRIRPIESWPSHSPDLNWQENVWEMMEQRVRERNPSTLRGLRAVLLEAWDDIDLGHLRNCERSMPDRLEAVIAARGGHTRY